MGEFLDRKIAHLGMIQQAVDRMAGESARLARVFVPEAASLDAHCLQTAGPEGCNRATDAAGVNRLAYDAVATADRARLERHLASA